jgi:hypothetical protein
MMFVTDRQTEGGDRHTDRDIQRERVREMDRDGCRSLCFFSKFIVSSRSLLLFFSCCRLALHGLFTSQLKYGYVSDPRKCIVEQSVLLSFRVVAMVN